MMVGVPALILLVFIIRKVYSVYFGPLSKFPGPKLAAATFPNELHIDELVYYEELYSLPKPRNKSEFFPMLTFMIEKLYNRIEEFKKSGELLSMRLNYLDSLDFSPMWINTIQAIIETGVLMKYFPWLLSILLRLPKSAIGLIELGLLILDDFQNYHGFGLDKTVIHTILESVLPPEENAPVDLRVVEYLPYLVSFTVTPVGMTSVDVHHNETIFPDSQTFKLERWLEKRPKESLPLDQYLVAFTKGSRQCIGIHFAKAALLLTLFDTTRIDVDIQHDLFAPRTAFDSKGVRVIFK
ncbi:cytochrome P450 [Hyaloscypha variabilis]